MIVLGPGTGEAALREAVESAADGERVVVEGCDIALTAALTIRDKAIRLVGVGSTLRGAAGEHIIEATNAGRRPEMGELNRLTVTGWTLVGHPEGLDAVSVRGTAGCGKYTFLEVSELDIRGGRNAVVVDVPDAVVYATFARVWVMTCRERGFDLKGVAMPEFSQCEVSGCGLNGYRVEGSIGLSMRSCASEGNNRTGSDRETDAAKFYLRRCNAFSMRACDVEAMSEADGPLAVGVLLSGCLGGEVAAQGIYETAKRPNQYGVRAVEGTRNVAYSLTVNHITTPLSWDSQSPKPSWSQLVGITQEHPAIMDLTGTVQRRL